MYTQADSESWISLYVSMHSCVSSRVAKRRPRTLKQRSVLNDNDTCLDDFQLPIRILSIDNAHYHYHNANTCGFGLLSYADGRHIMALASSMAMGAVQSRILAPHWSSIWLFGPRPRGTLGRKGSASYLLERSAVGLWS